MVVDDNIVTTESRSITSGTYTIRHPIKSAYILFLECKIPLLQSNLLWLKGDNTVPASPHTRDIRFGAEAQMNFPCENFGGTP